MERENFQNARPWLVHGVIKGTDPLAKEQSFVDWLDLEIMCLARKRGSKTPSPSERVRQDLQRQVLNKYAEECASKADQAKAALEVLLGEVIGLPTLPVEVWEEFVNRISFLYWYGQAEDWLKFHLNSLFCLATNQELPARPELSCWGPTHLPGVFLSGAGYRQLRRVTRMRLDSKLASLLLAKKGMPSMQSWKIMKSLQKHRVALTTHAPKTLQNLEDLAEQVKRTVDEIFPPSRGRDFKGVSKDLPFRIPSCSGHISTSRLELGAFKIIQEEMGTVLSSLEEYELLGLSELLDDGYTVDHDRPTPSVVLPWAELPGDVYGWTCAGEDLAHVLDSLLPTPLEKTQRIAQRLIGLLWSDPMIELGPHTARAVAIPEPLKVRVVTGGPEKSYYLASFIQKLVHGLLRKHPNFELIGRPLREEDLIYVFKGLHPDYVLVSGDYQAATDGLEPVLSETCAARIGRNLGLGPRARELFRSTLVNHVLTYDSRPVRPGEEREWHQQTMGQLMGSPTSFPVLCIVNAAATRYALEIASGRGLTLEETHMLINGDDILFPCRPEALPVWEEQTARCGLVKSVGKNFVSDKFCTINSDLWIVDEGKDEFGEVQRTPLHCPAVNLGLLLGTNVKKGHGLSALAPTETFRFQDISQMASDLVKGHDRVTQERLMSRFIHSWASSLKAVPPGVSWFVPKALGGLGLPWTREGAPDLSPQQLKLATYMASGCSVEEHVRRKALLQEKLGTISLWEKAGAILRRGMRECGLGSISFGDQPEDPESDWLGPMACSLFLSGERPQDIELDRAKLLWRNWDRLWRRGQAHSMDSLCWDVIRSFHGKEVKIALPPPPHAWRIRVDALSQRSGLLVY